VVKVFKKHTEPSVLHTAAVTIRVFQGYEVLKASHEAKIEALGASLLESFLNLVATVSYELTITSNFATFLISVNQWLTRFIFALMLGGGYG
jgi:hypothetical protein